MARLFLLLTTLVCYSYGYKVLMFVPGMSNSQTLYFARIGELLVQHGHEVTSWVALYNPTATKNKAVGVKEHIVEALNGTDMDDFQQMMKEFQGNAFTSDSNIHFSGLWKWREAQRKGCENQILQKDLLKKLKAEKFDIALTHMYESCPFGIVKLLDIPTQIWISSTVLLESMASVMGVPTLPSYIPNVMSAKSDKMDFWERLVNFGAYQLAIHLTPVMAANPQTDVFRKHYGEDFPHLNELAAQTPLMFVNSEELLDFPRPILHKIVYTGGIGMKEAKPLDKEWLQIIDSPKTKSGVILFSLGSVFNPSEIPSHVKKGFVDAFKRFPDYLFIVKSDPVDMPEAVGVDNIYLSNWIPQKDLLAHPRTKAFITHGGFNSLLESAIAGVPLLLMPLFGDQMTNQRRAERHGFGLGLNKLNVTADNVYNKLSELLINPSYRQNATRLARMIRKKPTKPDELLVKWVEFVAEFKTLPNLRPVGADMSTCAYLSLDTIGFSIGALVVGIWLVKKIFGLYIWSCFLSHRGKEKQKLN